MTETTTAAFLEMVAGRRGHFQLESGHHSGLWLDADFFAPCGVAVEAVVRDDYDLWLPAACPLCVAGLPLEAVAVTPFLSQSTV